MIVIGGIYQGANMPANNTKFIRLITAMELSGLKRATLYNHISKEIFPSQIKISERGVAWVESEIIEVNQARIAGKSDSEIKELIKQQEVQRQQICCK